MKTMFYKGMKIDYVLKDFPKLSETFILQEIKELKNKEVSLRILPIFIRNDRIAEARVEEYGVNKLVKNTLTQPESKQTILESASGLFSMFWNFRTLSLWKRYQSILEILKEDKPDVIHAHFATESTIIAYYLHRRLNVPFSFTAHGYDVFEKRCQLGLKKKIDESSGVVAICEYIKSFLRKFCDENKITVIHCGIDLMKFKPKENKESDKIRILSVSRLVEKKGTEYLILAFKNVEKRNVELNIVGSGPLEHRLMRLAKKLEIEEKIRFHKDISDEQLVRLYDKSDLFCLPCVVAKNGDMDGIPVSIMEAMAMRLPVVSTNVSGIPELVNDGKSGLLVPEKDVDKLSHALNYLIEDSKTRRKMGKNGRKIVERDFNIKKTVLHLCDFFRKLSEE